ncbi:unnamed protein product [Rotaria socialis]|uniref:Transmembrane protein 120 n=1 Tax=Rotaria socialis TaxID=392032 RepID=A0A821CKA9_9BILA|nr:unnamed protein product [Rotaria socialis]CAF3550358.1 unnamed protein product [Rotaria socialis]CAF3561491.1 unnamed protein product [Rotaria socialis]CAF3599765.1 unnamed protein product [Rotaria socialis]CAF3681091.1 unnamed protein product [Rotaria socialis]
MAATNESLSSDTLKQRRRGSIISSVTFDAETQNLIEQWEALSIEMDSFEQQHRIYLTHLQDLETRKKDHGLEFNRIQTKINNLKHLIDIQKSLKIVPIDNQEYRIDKDKAELLRIRRESEKRMEAPEKTLRRLNTIYEHLIQQRSEYLKRIKYTLPQPPETYLRIILGSELPVSILDKSQQWKYKEKYEQFKLRITLIIMIISLLMSTVLPVNRALDAIFHFLLVWYYCTLTIRESILIANGSNIQFWWRLHHFISTICSSIMLLWSSTQSYKLFRQQHYLFCLYISFVQVLLYYYQKGLLYRMRALGDSDELQITIEGFHSWMLRGLSFLAPFLFLGYLFQLYNAYILYNLSKDSNAEPNHDGHLMLQVLTIIYLILFLGNFLTMYMVIRRKIRERIADIQWLKHRYESVITLINRVRSVKLVPK